MTGSALRPSTFPVWLRRWQVVWVWLALAALAGVAACERKGRAAAGDGLPPVLKIGVYMPMTGDTATFGTSSMGAFAWPPNNAMRPAGFVVHVSNSSSKTTAVSRKKPKPSSHAS